MESPTKSFVFSVKMSAYARPADLAFKLRQVADIVLQMPAGVSEARGEVVFFENGDTNPSVEGTWRISPVES